MVPERDLAAIWTVLDTEASQSEGGIEAVSVGVSLHAGEVLAGIDHLGNRHLLLPLKVGEAFAEDRSGGTIQLVRVNHGGTHYMSAVCLKPQLNDIFAQFCDDLLTAVASATSTAQATIAVVDRWRQLFADADSPELLTEPKLIGLLAELLVLEEILSRDSERRLGVWTGPHNVQQDFRAGTRAIEVKATTVREGRIVSISSVEQLVEPEGGTLHLVHFRFDRSPAGETLPDVIVRLINLGVTRSDLMGLLHAVGYRATHEDHYRLRSYKVVSRRVYDVASDGFPRIIPWSFKGDEVPSGTAHITYSIDLTNEPPAPLGVEEVDWLFEAMSGDE